MKRWQLPQSALPRNVPNRRGFSPSHWGECWMNDEYYLQNGKQLYLQRCEMTIFAAFQAERNRFASYFVWIFPFQSSTNVSSLTMVVSRSALTRWVGTDVNVRLGSNCIPTENTARMLVEDLSMPWMDPFSVRLSRKLIPPTNTVYGRLFPQLSIG